jgi:hypothetical protein
MQVVLSKLNRLVPTANILLVVSLQCKHIHRTILIVVVTVTVVFIVGQLSHFIFTELFIQPSFSSFMQWYAALALGVYRPLRCVLLVVRVGVELEKSRSCGLNCLALLSVSLDCYEQFIIFFATLNGPTTATAVCLLSSKTQIRANWPNVGQHCLLHLYQAKQKVTITGIASSWSSVQVPFFCVRCTIVLRNDWIGSALVKKNTYIFVLLFNFWHLPLAKCFITWALNSFGSVVQE